MANDSSRESEQDHPVPEQNSPEASHEPDSDHADDVADSDHADDVADSDHADDVAERDHTPLSSALVTSPAEPPRQAIKPLSIAVLAAGVAALGVAVVVGAGPSSSEPATPQPAAKRVVSKQPVKAFDMPACEGATNTGETKHIGDPRARNSAQRGLTYLARAAADWQKSNNCYGCHVQAVTVEALAVGVRHQYNVSAAETSEVLRGMLDLPGGARLPGGLSHGSPNIAKSAKLMGAAAFARHDQWVDASLRDYLLAEARAIIELQSTDGQVAMPYTHAPVATGPIQGTAHAIVTWKQAYERTADDQWLTAVSRAEDSLHGVVASWKQAAPGSVQDMNYAIMGLIAAGVSNSEDVMVELARQLVARQNSDGGWGLHTGEASSVFATGQALYVLRLMGQGDSDPVVSRGTNWLIERQRSDGSWSDAGFGKAEAMWAVLGLVSIDVLSVELAGVQNGQHVAGERALTATARDNKGGGVVQVELFVDDIRVHGACGASLRYAWDTSGLSDGKHIVEVRARNARGEVSRRFIEVYAGDVYLTQIGTRYTGGGTEISLRNIAPAGASNQVNVEIFAGEDRAGEVVAGARLHQIAREGRQGSMSFTWRGEGAKQAASGKYVARLSFVDDAGKTVQTEDVVFVHDSLEAQQAEWAQLEGQLNMPAGDAAQNADVELIDEAGRVIGRTKSTRKGKFRFRNVQAKPGYKVRVNKKGYKAPDAPFDAVKGSAGMVDLSLEEE